MARNTNINCYNQIRMYMETFDKLCLMLNNVKGLKSIKHMLVGEEVAMFFAHPYSPYEELSYSV